MSRKVQDPSCGPLHREHAKESEGDGKRTFTPAEVFPDLVGKEAQVALRAYRHRQGLTQKQLSVLTGIPRYRISAMERGKCRIDGKLAEKLAAVLNCHPRRFQ